MGYIKTKKEASEMTQHFVTKFDSPSTIPGPSWWRKRTKSSKVSIDFYLTQAPSKVHPYAHRCAVCVTHTSDKLGGCFGVCFASLESPKKYIVPLISQGTRFLVENLEGQNEVAPYFLGSGRKKIINLRSSSQ